MREPEKAKELWFGDRLGGFEKPDPVKPPKSVSIPELKVTRILNHTINEISFIRSWLI